MCGAFVAKLGGSQGWGDSLFDDKLDTCLEIPFCCFLSLALSKKPTCPVLEGLGVGLCTSSLVPCEGVMVPCVGGLVPCI